jgi:hypothetical protein
LLILCCVCLDGREFNPGRFNTVNFDSPVETFMLVSLVYCVMALRAVVRNLSPVDCEHHGASQPV